VPGTLEAFGARVALGRGFSQDDFRSGERVAVVSESFWRRRLGGDSAAVGRTILVGPASGTAAPSDHRVIGVLGGEWRDPRAFGRGVLEMVVPNLTPRRTYVVRLREGVSPVPAERRLTDAVRKIASSLPEAWQGVKLESLHSRYVRDMRPVLLAVSIAAVLVFLIVCANVAVLLLLRALRRQREMAVRVALGAGMGHILRLLAIESALLCTLALAVALVVSATTMSAIAPAMEAALGRPVPHGLAAVRIDPTVAALVAAFGAAATVLLSAVPLLAPWQRRLSRTLRDGGRGATDSGAMRQVRTGLVTAQLAVSVALVVGCGLTIRSALHLVRADLGIETDGIFRAPVTPPRLGYEDSAARSRFYGALVGAMAGRSSDPIALSSFPVLLPANPVTFESEGGRGAVTTSSMAVTGTFFPILGMRIVQGRAFTDADRSGSEPVVIVSESFARRAFPGTLAVGQRIRTDEDQGNATGGWRTIVGIANDVRQAHTDDDLSDVYVPFFQQAGMFTSVYVRTAAPYATWLEALGASAREGDRPAGCRARIQLARGRGRTPPGRTEVPRFCPDGVRARGCLPHDAWRLRRRCLRRPATHA
jgi:putative ABC transport system permease protein